MPSSRTGYGLSMSLIKSTPHLLNVVPPPTIWNGTHYACQFGLGRILWEPYAVTHLWNMPLPPDLSYYIVTWNNSTGDQNMGEFDLKGSVIHITLMTPRMMPLVHVWNICDNTSLTVWTNHIYNLLSAVSGSLIRERALTLPHHYVLSRC